MTAHALPAGIPEGFLHCSCCGHPIVGGEVFVFSGDRSGWMCRACVHRVELRKLGKGALFVLGVAGLPTLVGVTLGLGPGVVAGVVASLVLWATPGLWPSRP